MNDEGRFTGLNFLIQYRRKDEAVWHNMAAFDVPGPAEKYFGDQWRGERCPWEYQLVNLEDGTITQQSPHVSTGERR